MNAGILGLTSKTANFGPMSLLGSPSPVPCIEPLRPPTSIRGLVAWFDASDNETFTYSSSLEGVPANNISVWRDKSDNRYFLAQTNSSFQPKMVRTQRGFKAVQFDGASTTIFANSSVGIGSRGLPAALSGAVSLTVFVVGEMPSVSEATQSANGTWVSMGGTNSLPYFVFGSLGSTASSRVQFRNSIGTVTGSENIANVFPSYANPAGDFFLCSVTAPLGGRAVARSHCIMTSVGVSTTIPSPRMQYGSVATHASARPIANTNFNKFTLGARVQLTTSEYFSGRLCQVLIFNVALTDSERNDVVRFLASNYSMTTPVM